MSYIKRLDHAFKNAPVLPLTPYTKYVFFSDYHRGIGNNNDNFLKNKNNYLAALQYYYRTGFCYIEVGDGDELWENHELSRIIEIHKDVFRLLSYFHEAGRLYMLYGNHDMVKKSLAPIFENFKFYEGIVLSSKELPLSLHVTHGHQADLFNSVFWRIAEFLVRYLWTPLEHLGFSDPTSAAKNNTKKEKIENRFISYAKSSGCLLLAGHTHRPMFGSTEIPYYNCGSCVHPGAITCIELNGFQISLVKWYDSTKPNGYFGNIYTRYPPAYPVYIAKEVLASEPLL